MYQAIRTALDQAEQPGLDSLVSAPAHDLRACSSTPPTTGPEPRFDMMTKVLAVKLGHHNMQDQRSVTRPGPRLPANPGATDAEPYVRAMLDAIPLGRTGHPKDIAETVTFVSSDRSTWTTGAVFEVTGGSQAGRTHMPVARPRRPDTHPQPHTTRKTASTAQ